MTAPTETECREEIETLHEFFVEWYAGGCDRRRFRRLERALAPGFELVSPDGDRLDRETVLEWIRGSYDRDDVTQFDIEIRNVEVRHRLEHVALVRYEEWQTTDDGTDVRLSTVALRSREDGIEWLDVHETALEGDGGGEVGEAR